MTEAAAKVLTALATQPDKEMTAVKICGLGHLSADEILPALKETTQFGWVVGRWEESETAMRGPRLYRLTDDGKQRARELVGPKPPIDQRSAAKRRLRVHFPALPPGLSR